MPGYQHCKRCHRAHPPTSDYELSSLCTIEKLQIVPVFTPQSNPRKMMQMC